MKEENIPNPNLIFPIKNLDSITYVKPSVKNPNIIVGDFTYFADKDFEKHVTHHYDFIWDKLIIGKFCQIATGVEFIMNGANHQMNAVSQGEHFAHQNHKKLKFIKPYSDKISLTLALKSSPTKKSVS